MDKKSLIILILAALVISGYSFYFFDSFPPTSDACDYAGMAKNIVNGKGFTINHAYPLSFYFVPELPQPDCMWSPAYSLVLAISFKMFACTDNIIIWTNIILYLALLIAGYLLAKRYADKDTAFVFLVMAGFNQYAYYMIIYSTPEILAALMLTMSVLILKPQKITSLIISAVLFGLAVLSRYQIIVLLPIYYFPMEKSYRKLGYFALIVVAICSWWLIRNFMVFGDPFFTLQRYGEYSKGMGLNDNYYYTYRSLEPLTLFKTITDYPLMYGKKIISGIPIFLHGLIDQLNSYSLFLVFWAYIFLRKKHNLSQIMRFTLISILLYIFLCLFDGQHHRHLFIFISFLSVIAAAGFGDFIKRAGITRWKYGYIFTLLIFLVPFAFPQQEITLRDEKNLFSRDKLVYQQISQITTGNVAAEAGDALWWYSNMNTVWMPVDFATLEKIDSLINIQAVYFQRDNWLSRQSADDVAKFNNTFPRQIELLDGTRLYLKEFNK